MNVVNLFHGKKENCRKIQELHELAQIHYIENDLPSPYILENKSPLSPGFLFEQMIVKP